MDAFAFFFFGRRRRNHGLMRRKKRPEEKQIMCFIYDMRKKNMEREIAGQKKKKDSE